MISVTTYLSRSMLLIFAVATLFFTGCKGPAGSDGPQGPQGVAGPIGPAGEDGSMMYAGTGAPTADIGSPGDYYLKTNTGEYYGPKDGDGWGNPIIVLMGEDGVDGQDGKDGTKIHSGNGAPKASLGVGGDFYMDLSSQDLYGPKTGNGWGKPISLNGEDGQDGVDGQDGIDGQDGEDGSQIYAGDGAPDASLGVEDDYYLDQTSKELYGPKMDSGWGSPINLSGKDGADGQDGTDGQDGADGKDGSQIYAGAGAPDASLGVVGDYYLDKSSYELYKPKTESNGWGMPLNLKGADGNANVTRYKFPGFADGGTLLSIDLNTEAEMRESAWLVYLVVRNYFQTNSPFANYTYFHIPGRGRSSVVFDVIHFFSNWNSNPRLEFSIDPRGGSSQSYDAVEIVRIESSSTENHTKQGADGSTIPDHLDTSNYQEVAEYYGFSRKQ